MTKEKTFTLSEILNILHGLEAEEAEHCRKFCELNPCSGQERKMQKRLFNEALLRVHLKLDEKAKGN